MTPRDFCFWLQGYLELRTIPLDMTAEQVAIVKQHLALVFVHSIDPAIEAERPGTKPVLDKIHEKPPTSVGTWPPPGGSIGDGSGHTPGVIVRC
jgi:hypothetical protein